MNSEFFSYEKPKFVSIRKDYFYIEDKKYNALKLQMQDMIPVRKFFKNGKLICYAINSSSSHKGKICSLCAERFQCFMKVRIMALIKNRPDKNTPAAIEIGKHDFKLLQEKITKLTPEEVYSKIIKITINNDLKLKNKLNFVLEN